MRSMKSSEKELSRILSLLGIDRKKVKALQTFPDQFPERKSSCIILKHVQNVRFTGPLGSSCSGFFVCESAERLPGSGPGAAQHPRAPVQLKKPS